jgi:hypothetical protein
VVPTEETEDENEDDWGAIASDEKGVEAKKASRIVPNPTISRTKREEFRGI